MSKRKRPEPKPRGSDHERKLHEAIQSKGAMGATKAQLGAATGIPSNTVTQSLNSLKTMSLIKEVQNIKNGSKHFVAVEFEPSEEITGSSWYVDGILAVELIKELKEICVRLLTRSSRKVMTLEGMWNDLRRVNGAITEKQVEDILENLVFDNRVMKVRSNGMKDFAAAGIGIGKVCYKLTRNHSGGDEARTGALASIPCGACPQMSVCTPDGLISPQNCLYFQKWLDF